MLCTVKKIEGTTVFVQLSDSATNGTIVLSEIAAGRIRNLRNYVSPNKKIVCKVLRIYSDHIELSLRRVTSGERQDLLDSHKKEKTFSSMLTSLKIDSQKIIPKIKESYDIPEFLEEARENPKLLQKFLTKTQAEELSHLLQQKKEKFFQLKKTFSLSTKSPSGLKNIHEILDTKDSNVKIRYLGSSKFSLQVSSKNPKEAEKSLSSLLQQIEKKAKQKNAQFSYKEK